MNINLFLSKEQRIANRKKEIRIKAGSAQQVGVEQLIGKAIRNQKVYILTMPYTNFNIY